MADEIKQRIVLEGEKQYRDAIREAQRNLKTLQSELKAETAELGKNASEQQKAELRTKSLQKQIAEQEKIVAANRAALKEAREKYGENTEALAKYEQRLNNARTTLANMKNSLDGVGESLDGVKAGAENGVTAVHSFAEAFGGLSEIGDSVAGAVESIFTGMIDTIRSAIGDLWGLIAETAQKANNWTDLANAYGTTPEAVQRITKALEWSGGSFDDLMTIIQKSVWSGDKKENVLKNALGISDVNYRDKLEYTMLVLERLKALKETSPGQYDSIIEKVYGGKQGTRLSWFLDNWDTIQKKLGDYDQNGYGMSEQELADMNDVWVELQTIEGKWNDLKQQFAAGFGTVTLDIMTNVNGALDALAKYFDADTEEEREQALEDLKKNITEAFTKLADAIREGIKILEEVATELQQSEDPIVRTIGNILGGITSALEWLTDDNWNNAKRILEDLAEFWIIGKGLALITKIGELAAHVTTIKTYKGLSNLGGLLAGSESSTGGGSTTGTGSPVVTTGGGALGFWGTIGTLGAMIYKVGRDTGIRRLTNPEQFRGSEEYLEASTGGNEGLQQMFALYAGMQQEMNRMEELWFSNPEAFNEDDYTKLSDSVGKLWAMLEGTAGFDELWSAYQAWRETQAGMGTDDWDVPADWWKNGTDENGVTSEDINNLNGIPQETKEAIRELIGSMSIELDGETVARILTPRVSENIAALVGE